MHLSFALIAHALLAAMLFAAALIDVRARRVPNLLIVTGLTCAALAHALTLGSGAMPLAGASWWSPLIGFAIGLLLLFPLHFLRAMGAGDVKLMAMVGAFIGAPAVLTATLYTLLAGGLLSLAFMLGKGVTTQTLANLRFILTPSLLRSANGQGARLVPLQTTAARLPYAVAIALGTGAALIWPQSA